MCEQRAAAQRFRWQCGPAVALGYCTPLATMLTPQPGSAARWCGWTCWTTQVGLLCPLCALPIAIQETVTFAFYYVRFCISTEEISPGALLMSEPH